MDYGKSFTYAIEDQTWPNKVAIGALITIVPILNFATAGYMVQITRNVMNQQPDRLPEWDDWGKKWTEGLMLFIAHLVYSLPFLLLCCIGSVVAFLPALGGQSESATNALAGLSITTLCLMGCLGLLYSLALAVVSPAVTIFYAREGTLSACFKIGEIVGFIQRNLNIYLVAGVVFFAGVLAVSFVAGIFNVIPICGTIIGLVIGLALGFYVALVAGHLYGQVAREAVYA